MFMVCRRVVLIGVLVVVSLGVVCQGFVVAEAVDWWPRFHHDAACSGASSSSVPDMRRVVWKYDEASGGFTSPIVVEGRVFVGSLGSTKTSYQGYVSCFDAASGSLLWRYTPVNASVYADPVYDAGRVYVGAGNWARLQDQADGGFGEIVCLSSADGSVVWRYPQSLYVEGGGAVVDGRLYVAGCLPDQSMVLCLDAATGQMLWNTSDVLGFVRAPVCVANGSVFITSDQHVVYCLNASTGRQVWSFESGGLVSAAVSVSAGRVYFGSQTDGEVGGAVYCLDAMTGQEVWRNNASVFRVIGHCTPAVAGGRVYLGTGGKDGGVFCLDAGTGTVVWSRLLRGVWYGVDSSPAVAGGKVLVGTNRLLMGGQLLCLNASDGSVVWRHLFPNRVYFSSPAVADGKVYYGIDEGVVRNIGTLFCFS